MRRVIHIELGAQLQWEVSRSENGLWIAVCDAVGLTMQSDSLDELYSVVDESTQLLFEDLFEDGELDSFLKARGWASIPVSPEADGEVEFRVPFELLVKHASDSSRPVH